MVLQRTYYYLAAMKYHLFLGVVLMLFGDPAHAQHAPAGPAQTGPSPIGVWLTQDHGGVIAISPCEDRLCARIVGVVLDHPTDPVPADYRGVSQCGLALISDARLARPGLWKGHILDPRNGDVFDVELKLDAQGRLALRGYLGVPLLGRTETWTRYRGAVPSDCRMLAGRRNITDRRPHSDLQG
jgi:uncharacterized protein (DUF2147 family)